MKQLTIHMTADELQAVLELIETQLFRVKFIDPNIPGHKANPVRVALANSAVANLRATFNKAKGFAARTAA